MLRLWVTAHRLTSSGWLLASPVQRTHQRWLSCYTQNIWECPAWGDPTSNSCVISLLKINSVQAFYSCFVSFEFVFVSFFLFYYNCLFGTITLVFYILLQFYVCHLIYSNYYVFITIVIILLQTTNLHAKGCCNFMDLKEYPRACCPANLSWLSDYILGALACSDMELNCAAGIWGREIALWVWSYSQAAWYCYACILPFQNCSRMLTVSCVWAVDFVDRV